MNANSKIQMRAGIAELMVTNMNAAVREARELAQLRSVEAREATVDALVAKLATLRGEQA